MSGVLGIDVTKSCWPEITDAGGIFNPRGDEWAGFAAVQGDKIIREAQKGKITPLMEGEESSKLVNPTKVILHVNQSPKNPQPAQIEETSMGPIALAFDGKIINKEELRQKSPYLVGSEASIIARLIGAGRDPLDGLMNVYQNIKGPFSLVLLTLDGIFAARDIVGIRPMIIGRFFEGDNPGCAVASESAGLGHIGMEIIRDVRPGEIISIEQGGFRTIKQFSAADLVICGFEYGYWARPSSIIEDVWVGEVRNNAGKELALESPEVDIISSFPMSGNTVAEGLHQALKIDYQSIFDYNAEAGGRSFLPFYSAVRARRAKNKLIVMPWAIKGRRIMIADDSVVEGNQTMARISAVRRAGALEVHLAIETPPIKYPCPFDVTPRGKLLAADHTIEEMRKILRADSLRFNTAERFVGAIVSAQGKKRKAENPLTTKNICMGCFTGEFPKYPNL